MENEKKQHHRTAAQKIHDEGNTKKWVKTEINRFRTKRLIAHYNKKRLDKNGRLTQLDYQELSKIHRPDKKLNKYSVISTRNFLMLPEVQKIADSSLIELLEGNNVSREYLINKRKTIIDKGIETNRLDTALKGVEGFENMHGMTNNNQKTLKITQDLDYDALNNTVAAHKPKIRLTEKRTITSEPANSSNIDSDSG